MICIFLNDFFYFSLCAEADAETKAKDAYQAQTGDGRQETGDPKKKTEDRRLKTGDC